MRTCRAPPSHGGGHRFKPCTWWAIEPFSFLYAASLLSETQYMPQKRLQTNFIGVFSRITTNPKRKHNGEPDRAIDICWRDVDGKQRWEVAGWLSKGMTEEAASELRGKRHAIAKKVKSLAIPTNQKPAAISAKVSQSQQVHPLFSIIAHNYLAWLEYESNYADRERIRYETHIKRSLGNLPVDRITISEADALGPANTNREPRR